MKNDVATEQKARPWFTLIAVALILPIPLALGMGLMTGVFGGSLKDTLVSLASYYVLWLVVDSLWIGWVLYQARGEDT